MVAMHVHKTSASVHRGNVQRIAATCNDLGQNHNCRAETWRDCHRRNLATVRTKYVPECRGPGADMAAMSHVHFFSVENVLRRLLPVSCGHEAAYNGMRMSQRRL